MILFQIIFLLEIMSYPADEVGDTPIQKIVIQPTTRSDFEYQHQNHSSRSRGRKIEQPIIKVLKKPRSKAIELGHPKKFDPKNPIHYTRAEVNGSFRQSPIMSINATMLK